MIKEINLNVPEFETCTVLGEPAIFSDCRFNVGAMPEGLYMYQLRHSDDGVETYCELARYIICNMSGTVFTKNPIDLGKDGFIVLNETNNTIGAFDAKYISMNEFIDSFNYRVTFNGSDVKYKYFVSKKAAIKYVISVLLKQTNKTYFESLKANKKYYNRILLSCTVGDEIKVVKWWERENETRFREVEV